MASTVRNYRRKPKSGFNKEPPAGDNKNSENKKEEIMSTKEETDAPPVESNDFNDFDFVDHYGDDSASTGDDLLAENTAAAAINCGFIGVGGGGGKLAKAFLDLGFNKTVLVNTTEKDQPADVDPQHFVLLPGADGVGKDVSLGKSILDDNGALIEDVLRNRLGKLDWLFVLAGGGGGTGSACTALHGAFERYLKSSGSSGTVVYVVTTPSAQELLNPTIASNADQLRSDVAEYPHIVLDNEKQLQLLRGKVGMLGMYPAANAAFAKMLMQILKLAGESSSVQTFDSKDLERCLNTSGRMFIGTTVIRDPNTTGLGATIFQGCLRGSPCPSPKGTPDTGVLLLVVSPAAAADPQVSNHLESAISYVGGRASTLFSGVYVKNGAPGVVAIALLGGLS